MKRLFCLTSQVAAGRQSPVLCVACRWLPQRWSHMPHSVPRLCLTDALALKGAGVAFSYHKVIMLFLLYVKCIYFIGSQEKIQQFCNLFICFEFTLQKKICT